MTADPSGMRASDADRDRVADVLKAALAEGRLTYDEHDQRLDQVLRSRTQGELALITADLPSGVSQHPVVQPNPWQGTYRRPAEPEPLATASLILGILGFFTGITAIPAVITGHLALGRIKRNRSDGHGMAVAGLVMGYLQILIGVVIAVFVIAMIFAFGADGPQPPLVP